MLPRTRPCPRRLRVRPVHTTSGAGRSPDIAFGWMRRSAPLLGLAVPGRLGIVGVQIVGSVWRGVQVLMDLLELAVNGHLPFDVLAVQSLDELMVGFLPRKSGWWR